MPLIEIPTAEIHDWKSFRDVFAAGLGFPEWYRRNPMAWTDCIDLFRRRARSATGV